MKTTHLAWVLLAKCKTINEASSTTTCTLVNCCIIISLVPRPLPDFISQLWRKKFFLHNCKIKSGSALGMRLTCKLMITNEVLDLNRAF